MPFMHIYNASSGQYDICCHSSCESTTSKSLGKRSVNDTLPFDHFFSDEMNLIRQKMINNEEIDACRKCYYSERISKQSKRLSYIEKFGHITETNKISIKMRIFGNYCNLSCYMCHPYNSTKRTEDLIAIQEIDSPNWRSDDAVKFTKVTYENVEKNILENISRINHIHITGGEPLQSLRMYKFLEKIPQEYANRILIGITTNLTKTDWKNKSLDDILEKFLHVYIKVSCDHYDEKLAWIRYPIDVDEFYENLYKYKNFSKISPAVSVLNVEDLYSIEEYYKKEFNMTTIFDLDSIVNTPVILTPANHVRHKELAKLYKDDPRLAHVYGHLVGNKWTRNRNSQRESMFQYLNKLTPQRGDWKNLWNEI